MTVPPATDSASAPATPLSAATSSTIRPQANGPRPLGVLGQKRGPNHNKTQRVRATHDFGSEVLLLSLHHQLRRTLLVAQQLLAITLDGGVAVLRRGTTQLEAQAAWHASASRPAPLSAVLRASPPRGRGLRHRATHAARSRLRLRPGPARRHRASCSTRPRSYVVADDGHVEALVHHLHQRLEHVFLRHRPAHRRQHLRPSTSGPAASMTPTARANRCA